VASQKKGTFGKSGGGDVPGEDQAFLSQIEENIRSKGNEQVDAAEDAEFRAREMERIRLAAGKINIPGRKVPAAVGSAATQSTPPKKANPLESDPRYKEYFERLRRQKGEQPTPAAGVPSQEMQQTASAATAASQKVGPGSIVRFDDGSIGVYKDAVSGRDYALFYFLNPDGQVLPEGVFLQCYQAKVLGFLPEEYFAQMRDAGSWNRDMIVFHMAKFEFVSDLDRVAEHEERKPKHTTPARNTVQQEMPAHGNATPTPARGAETTQGGGSPQTGSAPQPTPAPQPQATAEEQPAAKADDGLVKGRRFQIKFGGKQWQAVYWASEDENSIVAHDTHGSWSLMRLDLKRFKDSLELLDIVDSETMEAIAQAR
jgi:hypothetical protein